MRLLDFHSFCLRDSATNFFRRAILDIVKPGTIVADIGAGTGILSYFACQAGATHVYAIEDDDSIELGRIVCERNNLQEQVTFIKGISHQIDLPQPVDVVITNTLDSFGLEGGLVGNVIDARKRFLKPDGIVLPNILTLLAAPVEHKQWYEEQIDNWNDRSYEVDFSELRRFAANNLYPAKLTRDQFLDEPQSIVQIDLTTADDAIVWGKASFVVSRPGVMHGIGGWFKTSLAPGVDVSNEPNRANTRYNQAFLPLEHPIVLNQGDRIDIDILSRDGSLWRWRVAVQRAASSLQEPSQISFDQSTFYGFPISSHEVQQNSAQSQPYLSMMGEAELMLLQSFNGKRTIEELEQLVRGLYPTLFHSEADVGTFVRRVVKRCT